ncbi:hypothetical protein ACJ4V0_03020 [Phreatobacter sp. HK31-P]
MASMSARQVRSLVKKSSKRASFAAAARPMGACIITRHAPRTKEICEQLSQSDCDFINRELMARDAGFTNFFPGRACPK